MHSKPWGRFLLIFAACAVACYAAVGILTLAKMSGRRNDFAHYYIAAILFQTHEFRYDIPLEPYYEQYGFEYDPLIPNATNPPPLIRLFLPLVRLPPEKASAVWAAIQLVGLALSLWLTYKLLGSSGAARYGLFCAVVLASYPVLNHVVFSQTQFLLLAMVLSAVHARRRERHLQASLWVLLAGLLKLFPLVYLPWTLWFTRDRLRSKTVRTSIVFLVMLLAIAPDMTYWRSFVADAMPVIRDSTAQRASDNYSLPSAIYAVVASFHSNAPPENIRRATFAAGNFVGLVFLGLCYLFVLRKHLGDISAFSVLTCGILLSSVTTWPHYFVLLIPVVWALLRCGTQSYGENIVLWCVLVYFVFWVRPQPEEIAHLPLILHALIYHLPTLGLLYLCYLSGFRLSAETCAPEKSNES